MQSEAHIQGVDVPQDDQQEFLTTNSVKVFISWSKPTARAVAQALRDWLPKVIQAIDAWTSSVDIKSGEDWFGATSKQLANASAGILVVTKENSTSRWLHFEAGALTQRGPIFLYLVDMSVSQWLETPSGSGPLPHFQSAIADRAGTKRLLEHINERARIGLSDPILNETFERWWPDLEATLGSAPLRLLVKTQLSGTRQGRVISLVGTAGSEHAVTALDDGMIFVHTLADGALKHARDSGVSCLAPSGPGIVYYAEHEGISAWSVANWTKQGEHSIGPGIKRLIGSSGSRVVWVSSDQVGYWDWQSDQFSRRRDGPYDCVELLGHDALVFSSGNEIKVWSFDNETTSSLGHHDCGITALAPAPNGDWVVAGDSRGNVILWPVEGSRRVVLQEAGSVNMLAVTEDSRIAVAGILETVWVCRLGSRERPVPLQGQSWVKALATTPCSRLCVSGSTDGALNLWDLGTDPPTKLASETIGVEVAALSICDDGQTLIVGDTRGCVYIFRIAREPGRGGR